MLFRRTTESDDDQWAPVSDLMAVLMLVFMLIAVILSIYANDGAKSNEEKWRAYETRLQECKDTENTCEIELQETEQQLEERTESLTAAENQLERRKEEERRHYERQCDLSKVMLDREFQSDFAEWGAELLRDLTIRFTGQSVLYESGSSDVEQKGEAGDGRVAKMVREFFPRYMKVIGRIQKRFGEDEILAIRIEGHTSTIYETPPPGETKFIANMKLSQKRARKILSYALDPEKVKGADQYDNKLLRLITANGLSSNHIRCRENGLEDADASRRVEFKLLTESCQKAGRHEVADLFDANCNEEAYRIYE